MEGISEERAREIIEVLEPLGWKVQPHAGNFKRLSSDGIDLGREGSKAFGDWTEDEEIQFVAEAECFIGEIPHMKVTLTDLL